MERGMADTRKAVYAVQVGRVLRAPGFARARWFYGPELEFLRLRITLTFRPIFNYLGVKSFGARPSARQTHRSRWGP